MSKSEIIEKAIERLEQGGWIKGMMCSSEGRCIRGAMHNIPERNAFVSYTWTERPEVQEAEKIVAGIIQRDLDDMIGLNALNHPEIIVLFNDHPNTTKEMVIDKLTEAAKYCRNQGD